MGPIVAHRVPNGRDGQADFKLLCLKPGPCRGNSSSASVPTLAEGHRVLNRVMPVRNDVHRSRCTTLSTDETPAHTLPRAIQGKPVEPKGHGAFAAAVEALDVAGDVTACDPLGGAPRWKTTGPFRVSASGHPAMKAAPDTSGKLSIPWGPWAYLNTGRRGSE